jgi:hypothetical protein
LWASVTTCGLGGWRSILCATDSRFLFDSGLVRSWLQANILQNLPQNLLIAVLLKLLLCLVMIFTYALFLQVNLHTEPTLVIAQNLR